MALKNIIKVLLLCIPFVAVAQKTDADKFKHFKEKNTHPQESVLKDGNSTLNSVLNILIEDKTKTKPGDIFEIQSLKRINIEEANLNLKVIPLTSSNTGRPLALYVNNHFLSESNENDPVKTAYNILSMKEVKEKMGISDPHQFHIVSVQKDDLGMTHVKMDQYYNGIMIFGGQIYVHLKDKKRYSFINGRWFSGKKLYNSQNGTFGRNEGRMHFNITKKDIKERVKRDLHLNGLEMREDQSDFLMPDERWKISKVLFPDENKGEFRPAYVCEVVVNALYRYKYIMDAENGNIIRKQKEYCSFMREDIMSPNGGEKTYARDLHNVTREINIYHSGQDYFMIDISRSMFNATKSKLPNEPYGAIWTIDAQYTNPDSEEFKNKLSQVHSTDNTWDPKAVSAHFNAGYAYEYYKTKFNRESINNNGGNIISIINVVDEEGRNMDNAFWSGKAMFYGNGNVAFTSPLAKALDVAGHEMTHGVISSEANLEYYGESGAINESYADIYGAMMDREDWYLGEDVVNTSPQYYPSGALRDMSNPHNGSSPGSYGWQPAHTSEQYHGEKDNGGVHINSGIPNFAYYKFATAVGKDKAENVYYRALTKYLTKSSKFADLRIAIEQSAQDLYGNSVKQAASAAFDAVGISGSSGGTTAPSDIEINPGTQFILCTSSDNKGLYLFNPENNNIVKVSETGINSRPSISDNGRHVIFVGTDKKIHYIHFDWDNQTYEEKILTNEAIWRNAVISKDGSRLAAITSELNKYISVYDFNSGTGKDFELKNPTSAEGIELGNVEFADAMEFDYSGEWIMYDCKNSFTSNTGVKVEYWDIGFLRVWDRSSNSFAKGRTEKLFSELPDDVSIGNPTFSKNSPYIITFDYQNGNDYYILGANIETGEVGTIWYNNVLGFPNYSKDDKQIIFDYNNYGTPVVGTVSVDATKINGVANSSYVVLENAKWGVFFANGIRDFSTATDDTAAPSHARAIMAPNPTDGLLTIHSNDFENEKVRVKIYDVLGNLVHEQTGAFSNDRLQLDFAGYKNGIYLVNIYSGKYSFTGKVHVLNK